MAESQIEENIETQKEPEVKEQHNFIESLGIGKEILTTNIAAINGLIHKVKIPWQSTGKEVLQ